MFADIPRTTASTNICAGRYKLSYVESCRLRPALPSHAIPNLASTTPLYLLTTLRSAPQSTRKLTTDVLRNMHALLRGVFPSASRASEPIIKPRTSHQLKRRAKETDESARAEVIKARVYVDVQVLAEVPLRPSRRESPSEPIGEPTTTPKKCTETEIQPTGSRKVSRREEHILQAGGLGK